MHARRSALIALLASAGLTAGLVLAAPGAQALPAAAAPPTAAGLAALTGGFDRVPGTASYVDSAAHQVVLSVARPAASAGEPSPPG